ncbi:MAG: hypothetical protein WD625_07545, partial [Balneolales bacterium]
EFNTCQFVKPISVVPLAIVARQKELKFLDNTSYLKTIEFPDGQEISGFTTNGDTYFPLTRADLLALDSSEREKKLRDLSDKYGCLLKNQITDKDFKKRIGRNVSHLLISEMIDNIYEHAMAENAYIFSQYWQGIESCEICLADNGMGIYNSLSKAQRNVTSDLDAVEQVIKNCLSAKDEYGSQKRGTGIRNTIKLLSNKELKGFFCVISGSSGYFIDSDNRNYFLDLENLKWSGTIINMGFKKPTTKINIYDYIH